MRRISAASLALIVALLAFISSTALAGPPPPPTSTLYGFIASNRTLTAAPPGPVYDVIGDLIVQPTIVLTIEPGVTVRIATRDTLAGGDYPTKVEIDVLGHLVADATAGDSIRFVSAGGGYGDWGQIKIESGATALFKKALINGATIGLSVSGGGSATLNDVGITKGATGIGNGGSLAATNVLVTSCISGIVAVSGTGSLRQVRAIGTGLGDGGVGLTMGPGFTTAPLDSTAPSPGEVANFSAGVTLYPSTVLSNMIIRDNGAGVTFIGGSAPSVRYCTVVRNQSHGVSIGTFGSLINSISALNTGCGMANGTVSYSDLWSNAQSSCGYTPGPYVGGFSPFFVNSTANDFHLGPGSIFKNFSNSGGEIGAYGPGAGLPVSVTRSTWGQVKVRYR